jgi:hypothetical protein
MANLVVAVTTPNPYVTTTLSQQPYETNFVFEIEAEKIEYAFSI